MSSSQRPTLTVVIAVREVPPALPEALEALERQDGFASLEVVLADGTTPGLEDGLAPRFPWLRYVRPEGRALPALKAEGVRAARGEVVAVLDPWDVPQPGWVRAILDAMGPGGPEAVGGVVLLAGSPAAGNRGAYLFEYGAFNPPVREGPTSGDLPGNNVAYRRSTLVGSCADLLADEGFYKPLFHQRIRERGGSLVIRQAMRVEHRTQHRFLPFAVRRFHHGRCFGATRRRRSRPARRLLYSMLVPAVPALLLARHLGRAVAHPSNRRLLPSGGLALMGICLFWGLGEWVGCWGGPGRSCGMVY